MVVVGGLIFIGGDKFFCLFVGMFYGLFGVIKIVV